jgi:hypothetical protein
MAFPRTRGRRERLKWPVRSRIAEAIIHPMIGNRSAVSHAIINRQITHRAELSAMRLNTVVELEILKNPQTAFTIFLYCFSLSDF